MNKIFKNLQLLFLLLITCTGYAQFEFEGEVNLKGMVSSNEESPFWMYSNQRGRVTDSTNFVSWISGKGIYHLNENSSFEIGAGILFEDANNKFNIDELYGQYKNTWIQAVIGRKQKDELYNGLSASNENIIYSLNARPFPGIQLSTVNPIKISSKFSVELKWEEFLLEKDRYIKNARLHHKSFRIQYKPNNSWTIAYGLQHFAQWGGTRPNGIKEPQGFSDYLRIITSRGGGENSSQADTENVLGNHLGSHEIYVTKKFDNYSLEFLFNNLFEDGSGSRFGNFPDGRYGLFFNKNEENNLVSSFIYEFYYTKNQSKGTKFGADNYFNNGPTYFSGWTYYDKVIGAPLFTKNPNGLGVVNSMFIAHHMGIGGLMPFSSKTIPYKFLATYYRNNKTINSLYLFMNSKVYSGIVELELNLGADFHENNSPIFGGGLQISKKF